MKFCCGTFEGRYRAKNEFGPNIRIVKLNSDFLINEGGAYIFKNGKQIKVNKKRNDIKFFITMGYKRFRIDTVQMLINFCPFCGENLHEFYANDIYANEVEGETFEL